MNRSLLSSVKIEYFFISLVRNTCNELNSIYCLYARTASKLKEKGVEKCSSGFGVVQFWLVNNHNFIGSNIFFLAVWYFTSYYELIFIKLQTNSTTNSIMMFILKSNFLPILIETQILNYGQFNVFSEEIFSWPYLGHFHSVKFIESDRGEKWIYWNKNGITLKLNGEFCLKKTTIVI